MTIQDSASAATLPMPGDTALLRRMFGAFTTGVAVVTVGGDTPHGMTANSFTAVSLDPPLVLVCVDRNAIMHDALLATGNFGVSVLSAKHEPVAKHFANSRRPLGAAQFDAVDCCPGTMSDAPLISDAAAQFECELWRTYEGGDHTIFLGRVLAMSGHPDEPVLVFLGGRFRQLAGVREGRS